MLDFNIEIDKTKIKRNKHPDKKYTEKLATVISEISSILGIKNKPNNMITMSAIYNYMQLTFSLNEFKNRYKKDFLKEYRKEIEKIKDSVVVENDYFRVKSDKIFILDSLLVDLLHFKD